MCYVTCFEIPAFVRASDVIPSLVMLCLFLLHMHLECTIPVADGTLGPPYLPKDKLLHSFSSDVCRLVSHWDLHACVGVQKCMGLLMLIAVRKFTP